MICCKQNYQFYKSVDFEWHYGYKGSKSTKWTQARWCLKPRKDHREHKCCILSYTTIIQQNHCWSPVLLRPHEPFRNGPESERRQFTSPASIVTLSSTSYQNRMRQLRLKFPVLLTITLLGRQSQVSINGQEKRRETCLLSLFSSTEENFK